jgi:hypothetical protein
MPAGTRSVERDTPTAQAAGFLANRAGTRQHEAAA